MKEQLIHFIAQTSFNCHGTPSIQFLCSQQNNWGTYWSSDFNDEHLVVFTNEKLATAHLKGLSGSAVHSKWSVLDIEANLYKEESA